MFDLIPKNVPEIFNVEIVTRLTVVMNKKAAIIRLFEEGTGALQLKAAYGLRKAYLERGPLYNELATYYLVPIHKWLFSPISLLDGNFNPRNINHMPVVKISVRLELDENISFLDGHYLKKGDFVVIPDAKNDIHTVYHQVTDSEGIGRKLAVPISVEGELIGILRILTPDIYYFPEVEINFAMAVAEQSSLAIQRAIDYNKLNKTSTT